ncbi:hypothetical protein [Vibrio parahaemolyticus]|uniref:hypothetical protein n=1 Tax=Vibrio parahaemolyticus TaxID=670 RepID=UPI003D816486
MTIDLLEAANRRALARQRIGDDYLRLATESLHELIVECGGQSQAAQLISLFYGRSTVQGTVSKALQGKPVKIRDQLRFAIHQLTCMDQSTSALRALVSELGVLPVYHDIMLIGGKYAFYVGVNMVAGKVRVEAIQNQKLISATLDKVEFI